MILTKAKALFWQDKGIRFQCYSKWSGGWDNKDHWFFDLPIHTYRVHPDDLRKFHQLLKERNDSSMTTAQPVQNLEAHIKTKKKIAVMQAFCEGKKIEYSGDFGKSWRGILSPGWNFASHMYRVAAIIEDKTITVHGKKVEISVTSSDGEVIEVKLKGK